MLELVGVKDVEKDELTILEDDGETGVTTAGVDEGWMVLVTTSVVVLRMESGDADDEVPEDVVPLLLMLPMLLTSKLRLSCSPCIWACRLDTASFICARLSRFTGVPLSCIAKPRSKSCVFVASIWLRKYSSSEF